MTLEQLVLGDWVPHRIEKHVDRSRARFQVSEGVTLFPTFGFPIKSCSPEEQTLCRADNGSHAMPTEWRQRMGPMSRPVGLRSLTPHFDDYWIVVPKPRLSTDDVFFPLKWF